MAKRRTSPAAAPAERSSAVPLAAIRLPAILLVLIGAVAYANSLHGPFVLDDQESIVGNASIRQLWPPAAAWFAEHESPVAGRPVVDMTLGVNYAVGGLSVVGYHAVNVAIHLACALVLFGIVRRTSRVVPAFSAASQVWFAFAVAAVWLVHPLNTEAVDYVTQRTELLMGLFYLLTIYAAIRAYDAPGWTAAAFVACCLGVASKESMATVPIVILLYDRAFRFDSLAGALRQRWRLYAALASSWILLVALMSAGPRSSSTGFSTSVSSWTYLLNQSRLIVRYLRLAFWPAGLVIDYGVPLPLSFGQVWPYMAVLTLLFAATVIAFVRWPRIGFLGAWFFITLGPTSSVMPIATWVGAERRMYLPLVAIAALVLFALQKASKGAMRKGYDPLFIGAVAALVVACGMTTAARNRKYQSPEQLARSSVEHWPSGRARHWLGLELLAEGRRGEATEELNRAVADDPRTHYTLGVMAFQDRRFDAAIQELEAFARDEPMRAEVPAARQMIGRAMAEEGRLPDAERELRAALKMSPDDADMHAYLGDVLLKEQRFREAAAEYQQLLDRKPPTSGTLTNLGIALMADGKADAATKAFQRATELDPSDGVARRNLVQALVDQRRFADALPQAETAVGLRPDDAASHDNLGIALAATHQLDRAIAEFRRALTLNPDDGDIRGHLAAAERLKSAAE